jgi:hypothetical protein
LNEGIGAKRAEMIDVLWNAGLAGNVTAMKAWLALNDLDTSPKAIIRARAEPKLGKKEQALVDAKAAPHAGGWADLVRH